MSEILSETAKCLSKGRARMFIRQDRLTPESAYRIESDKNGDHNFLEFMIDFICFSTKCGKKKVKYECGNEIVHGITVIGI